MNIIREDIDELNAVLKVKVVAGDYLPKVESALREYQKKNKMPGFRPGKVPTGLIKKMYGKAIIQDEVYKILNDSLIRYLEENNIDIIGNPIPSKYREAEIDWDNQNDFEFLYDMGLIPKFNVDISPNQKFVYKKIKVSDEFVDSQIKNIANRYGKVGAAEISSDGDLLNGEFVELDNNGEILAGGIFVQSSLFPERIKDESTKKSLIGVKAGDKVIVDSQLLSESKIDLATLLNIDKTVAEKLTSKLQFTVKGITRMIPAEINQEFFDKLFGQGTVTSENELKEKIKVDIEKRFESDSDERFYNDVVAHLMNTVNFSLPNEFLKRWILVMAENNKDKETSAEEIEKDFDKYEKGYKWQLIENKIVKENNISVEKEELINYTQGLVIDQYAQYSSMPITEEEMEKALKSILSDEKQVKNIRESIIIMKMKSFFKSIFTLEIKEVDYDDFFNVKN